MNYQIQSKRIVADTVTNDARRLPKRNRSTILQYLFCALLSCFVTTVAQAQRISINVQNAPITRILEQIRKQSGHDFVYDSNALKNATAVTLSLRQVTLQEALRSLFANQPFTYEVNDKVITILPKRRTAPTSGNTQSGITAAGIVRDSTGAPLAGATIRLKGTQKLVLSDAEGNFTMRNTEAGKLLQISYLEHQTVERPAAERMGTITLNRVNVRMEIVDVNVNTGYQSLSPERTTGSFVKPDKVMFDSRVSTDVLSRLDGITSGMLFNGQGTGTFPDDKSRIAIRGLSTINSNAQPLIVVDNFPYDGDISNINPNDIEDITVLKDAAAASIWGAFSGNGVIVITTKKGRRNQPASISVNANTTIGKKPDLYYSPTFIPSRDLIELEKDLFSRGYYDDKFTNLSQPAVSPAVVILQKMKTGSITEEEGNRQIVSLTNVDSRKDLSDYLYGTSIKSQVALNLSGGSDNYQYYVSGGYDKNLPSDRRSDYQRLTLNFDNTFTPAKNLNFLLGINYVQNQTNTINDVNTNTAIARLPYQRYVDDNGNGLPIYDNYSQLYVENIQGKGFLDWSNNPIEQLNGKYNTNKNHNFDIRINTGVDYSPIKGLKASIKYQYQRGNNNNKGFRDQRSLYTRDLINRYSVVDASGNVTGYNVPLGAVSANTFGTRISNNIRGQIDYHRLWKDHEVNAIAGIEAREIKSESEGHIFYGYDPQTGSFENVNTTTVFPLNPSSSGTIGNGLMTDGTLDRYRSYFMNAAYTFKQRYTLSGSGRIDQSNLFGVRTNQRSNPLWSVGGRWDISKESFYDIPWMPQLTLRSTYGYNGNLSKSITAITTFQYWPTDRANGSTNLTSAQISNLGYPELTWEKIGIFNVALDFSLFKNVLSGTFEYYKKNGKDLIGERELAGVMGITRMSGNYAQMSGNGFDFSLTSTNIKRNSFKWESSLMVSHATDVVTKYEITQNPRTSQGLSITPIEGYPVYSIISYKYAGLDAETGDPQGYDRNGNISKDYGSLLYPETWDELNYIGSGRPTWFGGIRNTFSYGALDLSFNISYKFGYFFQRNTVNYPALFSNYSLHEDFTRRWEKSGDELRTTVPSIDYTSNASRANFYADSDELIEKGDHIRLQDISINYGFSGAVLRKLKMKSLQLYAFANNVGILWKATKTKLDPDFPKSGYPNPFTIAFGIKAGF